MKKLFVLILILLAGRGYLLAQWIKVVDENKNPISLVSIRYSSNQTTYVTNQEGLVKLIKLPQEAELLTLKHLGYEPLVLPYQALDTLQAVLIERIMDLQALSIRPTDEKALFKNAVEILKARLDDKKKLTLQSSYGRLRLKGRAAEDEEPHYIRFGDGVFFASMPYDRRDPGGKYLAEFGSNGFMEHHSAKWSNRELGNDYIERGDLFERIFARQMELWSDGKLGLFESKPIEAMDSFAEEGVYLYRYQVDFNEVRAILDVDADTGYPKRLEVSLMERPFFLNNFYDKNWLTGEMKLIVEYLVADMNEEKVAFVSSIRSEDARVETRGDEANVELVLDWDFQANSAFISIHEGYKLKRAQFFFLRFGTLFPNFAKEEWKSSGRWEELMAFSGLPLSPSDVEIFNWDHPNNPETLRKLMRLNAEQREDREEALRTRYSYIQAMMKRIEE